jgi:hypothetical protein
LLVAEEAGGRVNLLDEAARWLQDLRDL